jgi:hypothetical protein
MKKAGGGRVSIWRVLVCVALLACGVTPTSYHLDSTHGAKVAEFSRALDEATLSSRN